MLLPAASPLPSVLSKRHRGGGAYRRAGQMQYGACRCCTFSDARQLERPLRLQTIPLEAARHTRLFNLIMQSCPYRCVCVYIYIYSVTIHHPGCQYYFLVISFVFYFAFILLCIFIKKIPKILSYHIYQISLS